jgi:hypothetical protein
VGQDGLVSERPAAIKRLGALFSAAMIAHEAIFEMRRELIVEVEAELERVEPQVQPLLSRQHEIAARLRSMLEP